jgi:hypothetical protein
MPRGNIQNLKTPTPEQARERGAKGGRAYAENQKRRRLLKEELEALLEIGDNQARLCLSLYQKALEGDVRAFEALRDTIGQKPKDALTLDGAIPVVITGDEEISD